MRHIALLLLISSLPFAGSAQFDPSMAPFHHGVASGDALSDRVIIWTRITPDNPSASYSVAWEMYADEALTQSVGSGTFSTDASRDFTVKVDVTGLQPNSWYWYRFSHSGDHSLIGRTRTAPAAAADRLRFVVVSCQNFGGGNYFNAYHHIAQLQDIDAVIHLGDYIYEGGGSVTGNGIQVEPAGQATVSLEQYRQRYASYRLDANLRETHRKWPFYTVWDDHESANNSWKDGAENHNPATQGDWYARLAASQQAYFEWLPIRPKAEGSYSIYRTIPMGPLADLIMVDTRIEGRDQEVGLTSLQIDNPNRTLLGAEQKQWLKDQLSSSTAKWKIIGNQVMFAPLELPAIPFLFPNGGIINADQWDGYRPERTEIINHLHSNGINNTVILTGDIHTSWGNDVPRPGVSYNPTTGAGSVAVEFVTTSITSSSFPFPIGTGIISTANPHMKHVDLSKKGYLILDVDNIRVHGQWIYVSAVDNPQYTVENGPVLVAIDGQNYLRPESALSAPDAVRPPSALSLKAFPNPTQGKLTLSIGLQAPGELRCELYELSGRQIAAWPLGSHGVGELQTEVDMSERPTGLYMIRVFRGSDDMAGVLFVKE